DKAGLGRAAGEALVRMIEDTAFAPPVVTLPIELVVRDSTGPAGENRREATTKEVQVGGGPDSDGGRRNRFRRRQEHE
ncbi:hypothetical protein, partial [Salmonella sp. SAL4431]|uniref:hypothetical protein n=1 Tax=Salmonella sp. SAL4431 TaxID=3159886 RepID=UPI003978174A